VSSSTAERRRPRLTSVSVAALLLVAALGTWVVAGIRMRGMDAGPGTDLGAFGWYVGVWTTMMAAMMFPSATPMVLLFHRVSSERARRGQSVVPTWFFVVSYLAVWTAYGLAAYGFYRLVIHIGAGFLAWNRGGAYVAGAAIGLAGIYELTPLKSICLRHCRSPLHFVLSGWRDGRLGALRMGVEHGGYCVGCCWGLMVVFFALGVMSLIWMAAVALLIFAQKVLPRGELLTRIVAGGLVAVAIWVAAAPGTIPGLTQPNSAAADKARMRMMNMTPDAEMESGQSKDVRPMKPPAMNMNP
jgi:predicted metal-binding membrane protein